MLRHVLTALTLLTVTFATSALAQRAPEGEADKKATSSEGCWPLTAEHVKECKSGCNKNAQSYESCKSNCDVMNRNCKRRPGEAAEQTRQ